MTFYCSFRFPRSLMKYICGYDYTLHKIVCAPEESKVQQICKKVNTCNILFFIFAGY